MRLTTDERRAHPRREIDRACKIRVLAGGKYLSGRTRDVSSGGTLIMLDRRSNLSPGDEVDVGIAWTDAAIIREDDMARGRVVRVGASPDERDAVGIMLSARSDDVALAA